MKFKCPSCQYEKTAPRRFAGRMVSCPKCKTQFRVGEITPNSGELDESIVFSDSISLSDLGQVKPAASNSSVSSSPVVTRPPKRQQPPAAAGAQQVVKYDVNSGPLGKTTAYGCPGCGTRLTSPLNDAGGSDACPDCSVVFIVPGEKEQANFQKQRQAEIDRKVAQREQRTEASSKAVVSRVVQQQQKQENVQLDRDPMLEWFVYAAVLIGLLAVVAGRYLVSAIQTDSSYLCVMIIVLFILGSIVNFLGMRRLRNEYVCAAVCMNNLKKTDGLESVCQGPAAGVFHQHVMDLGKIAQHDSNLSQDSLVTLLYSRMMAKSKMVDILGGVLVTLGLIGTIVGLISMTDGLSATLSSLGDDGEAADLLSGMRSTMFGLGTAFNTTLVGAILGSVVLRILNNVYTSNVDHLVTYVATTTEVNIVPMLKRKSRKKLGEAA